MEPGDSAELAKEWGQVLRKLRRSRPHKPSQHWLAEKVGVHKDLPSKWEQGKLLPRYEKLHQIRTALKLTSSEWNELHEMYARATKGESEELQPAPDPQQHAMVQTVHAQEALRQVGTRELPVLVETLFPPPRRAFTRDAEAASETSRDLSDRQTAAGVQSPGAASFPIGLIKRFQVPDTELVATHRREAEKLDQANLLMAAHPPFSYTVSIVGSQSSLARGGVFQRPTLGPEVLLPTDDTPFIALHGGGGTGKTRIARMVMSQLLRRDSCPVFLDLKKVAGQVAIADTGKAITDMIVRASAPRRTPTELRLLASQSRLTVIIDGLNEVSREARTILVEFLTQLHDEDGCYILATVRHGFPDQLPRFIHAVVDRLDPATAQRVFDGHFGEGKFAALAPELQRIYRRPFFLSLAVRSNRQFEGKHVWSGIFEEFFLVQLTLQPQRLIEIARATFTALDEGGGVNTQSMKDDLGSDFVTLVNNEVLTSDGSRFEHELWRDFLISRCLAKDPDRWNDRSFDAATTFASSPECLSLTVEQLDTEASKDAFLKTVYDWNYVAAADCLKEFNAAEPAPRRLNLGIRVAVLAAIAEKRFDDVKRTRDRADEILRGHLDGFARAFAAAGTRDELVRHVQGLNSAEGWYAQWRRLFSAPGGRAPNSADVQLVASQDSLIGWTATNLIRRSIPEESDLNWLRSEYRERKTTDTEKTVRWRIVHVLGAHPADASVELLVDALTADPYHWVRYGAARSLVEIAAKADDALADRALAALRRASGVFDQYPLWMRRQIRREIIEAAFVRDARPGWQERVQPTLRMVAEQSDAQHRAELESRLVAMTATEDWE